MLAGAVQHYPQIALGDIHVRANLGVGALLHFIELKDLGDARREFAEREFKVRAELGQFHTAAG